MCFCYCFAFIFYSPISSLVFMCFVSYQCPLSWIPPLRHFCFGFMMCFCLCSRPDAAPVLWIYPASFGSEPCFLFFLPLFSLTVNMDYPCVKPPACILNSDNKNYIHPNKEHAEFTLLCHVSSNGFFFWVNHNVYIFMHLSSQVLVSCGLVILFH